MIPTIFLLQCKLASISKLLLALVVVQNASVCKLYSDLIARLSVRNDKHLLLGTMIVWQFSGFGPQNSLHSNKFFFDKSKSIQGIKKFLLQFLLRFLCRKGLEIKKGSKKFKNVPGLGLNPQYWNVKLNWLEKFCKYVYCDKSRAVTGPSTCLLTRPLHSAVLPVFCLGCFCLSAFDSWK